MSNSRWWSRYTSLNDIFGMQNENNLNNTKIVFGATYQDLNNPFYIALNNGIKEVVDKNGDQLITLDGKLDNEVQKQVIDRFIDYGVDGILLAPVDWIGIKPSLERAKAKGVPVFNIATPVYDQELVVNLVESNNYDAGVQNAINMIQRLDKAKIAIIERQGVKSSIDRVRGFLDTIQGKPQYEVVTREITGGLQVDAIPVMEKILKEHPDINVLYAVDDPTALGAIQVLQAAGISDVLVYSVDGSPEAKLMVKLGKMAATVAQAPYTIGTVGIQEAYKYLAGEPISKYVLIPVQIITQENIDLYGVEGWQVFD